MRIALAVLGVIARPLAVAWVYWIWFRSPRYKTPRREIIWRDQARRVVISSRFGRVMTYTMTKTQHNNQTHVET